MGVLRSLQPLPTLMERLPQLGKGTVGELQEKKVPDLAVGEPAAVLLVAQVGATAVLAAQPAAQPEGRLTVLPLGQRIWGVGEGAVAGQARHPVEMVEER